MKLPVAVLGVVVCLGSLAGQELRAGVTSLAIDFRPDTSDPANHYFCAGDPSALLAHPFGSTPGRINLHFHDFRSHWALNFAAPQGQVLAAGIYEDAHNPNSDPGRPSLNVSGTRLPVFCAEYDSRFEVKQVAFDQGGELVAFWATFEQGCYGIINYRGEVRFNADVPVILVAPSSLSLFVDRHREFAVEGHDAAGDPVALSATGLSGGGLPAGSAFTDLGDGTGRFEWTPEAGQIGVHWVALHGQSAGGDTDTVSTRVEVIPDFDDFDRALPIGSLPFQGMIDRPEAGSAADDPTCLDPAPATVWYAYTPTEDGRIEAVASGPFNGGAGVGVSIYSGERFSLEQVACGFHGARADVVGGKTYHIMAGFFALPVPQYTFSVRPLPPRPPNDDFDAATVIGSLPFENTIDLAGSDTDAGDPRSCRFPPLPAGVNAWYAYTPPQDTRVTIEAAGPLPWEMAVFTGPREALARVGCGGARLSFTARAGVAYHVVIGVTGFIGPGFGGIGGSPASLPLQVSFTGMPALQLGTSIAPEGRISRGTVLVAGTVQCSRPAEVVVSGTLRQTTSPRGRQAAGGAFETTVQCNGETRWFASVAPPRGSDRSKPFKAGPAVVTLHVTGVPGDNPDDLAVDDVTGPILLKIERPGTAIFPAASAPPG